LADPAKAVTERLRYMGAGLLAMLNTHAFRLARRDFPHLLVEDPARAYRVVLEYTRGDRGKARYILSSILVGLVGSPAEVEEALRRLEEGDPGPLRGLLEQALKPRRRRGLF